MRRRAGTFSVERLMRFLTALDQDVEITVRPKDEARSTARLSVLDAQCNAPRAQSASSEPDGRKR